MPEKRGFPARRSTFLENGLARDLGMRKVLAVLDYVGLDLAVRHELPSRKPDYVQMACTTANVSFKSSLTEDELIHSLMTGKVPPKRAPHLRALIDEAPEPLLRGLLREAAHWTRPGKLQGNLRKLAQVLGTSRSIDEWFKTD